MPNDVEFTTVAYVPAPIAVELVAPVSHMVSLAANAFDV